MKIAVEGCAHGELEKIYECIETIQSRENINIDLLICCGDFQSVRNNEDLRAMAVPEKYQDLRTFYKYYSGEKRAPVLTLFIGGNHEASNYLQELPYGGWVAPNIYYMGRAGVVKFGNLRIGGLSGIFKNHDYLQGLWECPPYTQGSLRSVYHIRSLDVFRLSQLGGKLHVMLSHDWPRGITDYGNVNNLLKRKPFFREDIESKQLGSPPAEKLLQTLKPDYWFAAHLHCQFAAIVNHENDQETKFLALDKCLPQRRHLQILDVGEEYDGDKLLKLDEEWLAVLKNTNHLLSVKNIDCHLPGPGSKERYDFTPTVQEIETVKRLIDDMIITEESFVQTAAPFNPEARKTAPSVPYENPQTKYLCEKLGIDDPLQVVMARAGRSMRPPTLGKVLPTVNAVSNPIPEESLEVKTPIKHTKLSLPPPITPRNDENLDFTEDVSVSSNDVDSSMNTSDCTTPTSFNGKKTFKRRNQALYTPDTDGDNLSTSTSSFLEESPRSSKLPFRAPTQDNN